MSATEKYDSMVAGGIFQWVGQEYIFQAPLVVKLNLTNSQNTIRNLTKILIAISHLKIQKRARNTFPSICDTQKKR